MLIKNFKYFDLPIIFLIAIFFYLYFNQIFVANESIALATGFEVDPGSILQSIHGLYQNDYNSLKEYHSKFYGWSQYSITFLLSLPIHWVSENYHKVEIDFFLLYYRFIFFFSGLALIFVVYKIIVAIFNDNHKWVAFALVLSVIISPFSKIFVFLHPEPIGLLFLLAAIYFIIKKEEFNLTEFIFVLVLINLAALSKQIFFFASIPLYFYLLFFCKLNTVNSNYNWKLLYLILSAIVVLFLIHPYALLKPDEFIYYQLQLSTSKASSEVTFYQSLVLWVDFIYKNAFLYFSYYILGLVCFFLAVIIKRDFIPLKYKNVLIIFFVGIFALLFVSFGNRVTFAHHYIVITYFLGILLFAAGLMHLKSSFVKGGALAPLILLLIAPMVLSNYSANRDYLSTRLDYKSSIAFVSFSYIEEKIGGGSRIAHDHNIVPPTAVGITSCSYWHGCRGEGLKEFNPDFIIFSITNSIADPDGIRNFNDYIRDNNMQLLDRINFKSGEAIMVYKKNQ
jgi:hypothetical protein